MIVLSWLPIYPELVAAAGFLWSASHVLCWRTNEKHARRLLLGRLARRDFALQELESVIRQHGIRLDDAIEELAETRAGLTRDNQRLIAENCRLMESNALLFDELKALKEWLEEDGPRIDHCSFDTITDVRLVKDVTARAHFLDIQARIRGIRVAINDEDLRTLARTPRTLLDRVEGALSDLTSRLTDEAFEEIGKFVTEKAGHGPFGEAHRFRRPF